MLRGSLGLGAVLALVFAAAAGCSSGSGAPPCGSTDAAVYEVGLDFPAGCPPAEANEIGIGKPCGMCGNQCASGLNCTCDPYLGIQLTGLPCICTKVGPNPDSTTYPNACTNPALQNVCGSDATCCPYVTAGYFCSPNVCLPGGSCIEFVPIDAGM